MPWELDSLLDLEFHGVKYTKKFISEGLNKIEKTLFRSKELDFSNNHAIVSYFESSHYMRCQLLRDTDWAGMAHSLEIRVPIVDKNVLTYLYKSSYILNTKPYLKKDLANCAFPPLLSDVLSRSKTGFTVPVKAWFMKKNTDKKIQHGQRDWQNYVMANFL